MKTLTRKEELILLSIITLRKNAYLVSIVDHLSAITGKRVSITSVHVPLSRLEKTRLIEFRYGESTSIRGGRRKKIYTVSKKGYQALAEHKRISDTAWKNYLPQSTSKD